jgi:hypothetical protein
MNLCSSKPVLYLKVALRVLMSGDGVKGLLFEGVERSYVLAERICNVGHISPQYQEATACSVQTVPDSTKDT